MRRFRSQFFALPIVLLWLLAFGFGLALEIPSYFFQWFVDSPSPILLPYIHTFTPPIPTELTPVY